MRTNFNEVRTQYTDENNVTHIDGYRTDNQDEGGIVLGYIVNRKVYWTNPNYAFDELVKLAISDLTD